MGVGVLAAGVVRVAGRHHRQAGVARQPPQVLVDAGLHVEAGVLDLHVDVVAPEDAGQRVELGAGRGDVVALEAAEQTTPDRQPESAMMPSAWRSISSCEMRGLRW